MLESWINRINRINRHRTSSQRSLSRWWLGACTAIAILIVSAFTHPLLAQPDSKQLSALQLPDAAIHSLPTSLETWVDPNNAGDYFDQIASFGFGYLVWSHFPIQVYANLEPFATTHTSASKYPGEYTAEHLSNWHQAIASAVQEWHTFLPLEMSDRPDHADIIILAQTPPLRWPASPPSSLQESSDAAPESAPPVMPRAQTAETTYKIQLKEANGQTVMKQQYTIQLSPNQSLEYLHATARHELGHALGLWGHSPDQGDVLYFSQVQTPPLISARDINTLKKLYQQPTQLGWPVLGLD